MTIATTSPKINKNTSQSHQNKPSVATPLPAPIKIVMQAESKNQQQQKSHQPQSQLQQNQHQMQSSEIFNNSKIHKNHFEILTFLKSNYKYKRRCQCSVVTTTHPAIQPEMQVKYSSAGKGAFSTATNHNNKNNITLKMPTKSHKSTSSSPFDLINYSFVVISIVVKLILHKLHRWHQHKYSNSNAVGTESQITAVTYNGAATFNYDVNGVNDEDEGVDVVYVADDVDDYDDSDETQCQQNYDKLSTLACQSMSASAPMQRHRHSATTLQNRRHSATWASMLHQQRQQKQQKQQNQLRRGSSAGAGTRLLPLELDSNNNNINNNNVQLMPIFMTLFIALALSVPCAEGGACWQKNLSNGKCNEIFSLNITKTECCSTNQEFSYTDRELSSVEYFFATAIGGGMECAPCLESCKNVNCGPNKKCAKRKGRPKCICAPECGAAIRKRKKAKLFRGDAHMQFKLPQIQQQHHSDASQRRMQHNLDAAVIFGSKTARDVRSLSSEIHSQNIGLDDALARRSWTAVEDIVTAEAALGGLPNLSQRKFIVKQNLDEARVQQNKRKEQNRLLIAEPQPERDEEKTTTRRLQVISNVNNNNNYNNNNHHHRRKSPKGRKRNRAEKDRLHKQQQQQQQQEKQQQKTTTISTSRHKSNGKNKNSSNNGKSQSNNNNNNNNNNNSNNNNNNNNNSNNNNNNNNNNNKNNNNSHNNLQQTKNFDAKLKHFQQQEQPRQLEDATNREQHNVQQRQQKHQHLQQQQYDQHHGRHHQFSRKHKKKLHNQLKDQNAVTAGEEIDQEEQLAGATTVTMSRVYNGKAAATTTQIKSTTWSTTPANSSSPSTSLDQQRFFKHGSTLTTSSSSTSSLPTVKMVATSASTALPSSSTSSLQSASSASSSSSLWPTTGSRTYNGPVASTRINVNGRSFVNSDDLTFDDRIYDKFHLHGFPNTEQKYEQLDRIHSSHHQHQLHHHQHHPVCGTDGRTYNTECQLKKRACRTDNAELTVAYQGHCRTTCNGVKCLNGLTCVEDHYTIPHCIACRIECPLDDLDDLAGTAADDEARVQRAVCGVDGKTYRSVCDINRMICKIGRSIGVAYPGPCRDDRVTCNDINCGPKRTCLVDLLTHEPRCVSCRYKCARKRRPASLRFEEGKICGVNNRTYNSWCEMRKDSCATGYNIDVKQLGVCQ